MQKINTSVIILAAGKSSRMGVPKLSLKFDAGKTFLEHVINEYSEFGCDEIVVVVNAEGHKYIVKSLQPFPENVKIAINEYPERGRFHSLKTGCLELSRINSVFVHNVDNPFVNQKILNALLAKNKEYDYVMPSYEGKGGHPVLISKDVVTTVIPEPDDQQHLKEFLNRFSSLKEDVDDEKVLVNINDNNDYKKWFNH